MRPLLKQAQGKVLVCGLGLGYFAYHLSRKDNVEQIIVVEKEAEMCIRDSWKNWPAAAN